jgi:subtilase family serine protease
MVIRIRSSADNDANRRPVLSGDFADVLAIFFAQNVPTLWHCGHKKCSLRPGKNEPKGPETYMFVELPSRRCFGKTLALAVILALPRFAVAAQVLHSAVPAASARLTPIRELDPSTRLNVAIGLPLRNQAELLLLLEQLYDPRSTNYHRYLNPEQFAERFGPTEQDYHTLSEFIGSHGLQVSGRYSNRVVLDASGSVADLERLFHVKMQVYQHPTEPRTFYSPDVQPSLDLSVPVLGISGLDNYSLPHPRLHSKQIVQPNMVKPNAGSGPGGAYSGRDFRNAYVPKTTLTGSGQSVGLLEFDGYSSGDTAYYEQMAGLPNVPLKNVLLDGFDGNPTGDGGEVEVTLDIEVAISMAPGLSQVVVYEAGPNGNWYDLLNQMASDDLKQLSCSWYSLNSGADPVADQIWQQMAAQGQSFLNASGDNDAYVGPIDFPGDSPYITQVGGTTLTTSGPGGSWVSETVWNWGGGTGSSGGVSTSYSIPTWQANINMTANLGSTTNRNTPDVALTADNVYVRVDETNEVVGGTSCAAPLWASFVALCNQQALSHGGTTVGFLNPSIYALGKRTGYPPVFHDITTGNNQWSGSGEDFPAVRGYDLCTGWGTPFGPSLIPALLGWSGPSAPGDFREVP